MILIAGAPRSGTSLVTGIIRDLGANLGDRVNRLNENTNIRETLLKPYLKHIGADPLGQNPLPSNDFWPRQPNLAKTVLNFIPEGEPRAYKDPKLTLCWPAWHEAFPKAKWVLVRRNSEAIADSCMRTDFMNAFKHREAWKEFVRQHEIRFEKMKRYLDIREIWTDKLIADPDVFEPICRFLNLPFDREVVEKAIEPDRWH